MIAYLTLILLTWRIWRTPNNVSTWQMGFNSAFKGLKALNFTYEVNLSASCNSCSVTD